jgi:hypothetical protein
MPEPLTVKVDERLLPKEGRQRTSIHDPELKRLRAMQMMDARAKGYSLKEVAEMFRVSDDTVVRTLTYAKRAGILVEAADNLLRTIQPLAETAIVDALKDRDVDPVAKANIALRLYEGVGLLGNKGKPSGTHSDDSELERAMKDLREKAKLIEETTEGELLVPGSTARLLIDGAGSEAAGAGTENIHLSTAFPSSPQAAGTERLGQEVPPSSPEAVGLSHDESGPTQSEQP